MELRQKQVSTQLMCDINIPSVPLSFKIPQGDEKFNISLK